MPRLGGEIPTRHIPGVPFRKCKLNLRNIGIVFVLIFIIRNLFRSDYAENEMAYLRNSGIDENRRHIPKTPEEQRQYVADESNNMERMKKDIAYLLQEVHELRAQIKVPKHLETDAELAELDRIHLDKRKKREEELAKEHPDFKPSRHKEAAQN